MAAPRLLVLFVLIIAGDSFLKEERKYVTYFQGTIFGLKIGSNVMFRGVPIGYVSDIDVLADFDTMEFSVPVTITIIPDSIRLIDPEKGLRAQEDEDIGRLVERGLRATLASESLITGQLYVELDFFPDTEVHYRAPENADLEEIPSVPSGIQEVIENAQRFVADIQKNLDVPKVMADVTSAIEGLDALINRRRHADHVGRDQCNAGSRAHQSGQRATRSRQQSMTWRCRWVTTCSRL